jgi:hypothetical protein
MVRLVRDSERVSAPGKSVDRRVVKTLEVAGVGITSPATHGRKGGEFRGTPQAIGGKGGDATRIALRRQSPRNVPVGLPR